MVLLEYIIKEKKYRVCLQESGCCEDPRKLSTWQDDCNLEKKHSCVQRSQLFPIFNNRTNRYGWDTCVHIQKLIAIGIDEVVAYGLVVVSEKLIQVKHIKSTWIIQQENISANLNWTHWLQSIQLCQMFFRCGSRNFSDQTRSCRLSSNICMLVSGWCCYKRSGRPPADDIQRSKQQGHVESACDKIRGLRDAFLDRIKFDQ